MKMFLVMALFALMALVPTFACPTTAGSTDLCTVKPFTAQTNYMSFAGYTRWQQFQQTVTWIPRREALAQTKQELALCGK